MEDKGEAIKRLTEVLRVIEEDAPSISTEEYKAFLFIAQHEGASVKEVQEGLGLPQSSTSRVVSKLNGGGLGLVQSEPDPDSRRKLRLRLTKRGTALLARLTVIVGCLMSGTGEDLMESFSAPASYFGSMVAPNQLAEMPDLAGLMGDEEPTS